MPDMISQVLSQLAIQSPVLLVHLAGVVVAFACWQRMPTTSLLVLMGAGIMLATSIARVFLYQYLSHSTAQAAQDMQQRVLMFTMVGLLTSIVYAGGLALLVAAAFVGRRQRAEVPSPFAPRD